MKKILFYFVLLPNVCFSQNSVDFKKYEGVPISINYAQVLNNQKFCTYQENESTTDIDSLWQYFYATEILKYRADDSSKLVPLHQYSVEIGTEQWVFLKYFIATNKQPKQIFCQSFTKENNTYSLQSPNNDLAKKLFYLFCKIQTDKFQHLFSREDYPSEPQLNSLKNKVLDSEGYVNMEELVRQLQTMEIKDSKLFMFFCEN